LVGEMVEFTGLQIRIVCGLEAREAASSRASFVVLPSHLFKSLNFFYTHMRRDQRQTLSQEFLDLVQWLWRSVQETGKNKSSDS
jgi:hypothetical protein